MTPLIDALKGLLSEMDEYDPSGGRRECDRYEFAKVERTRELSERLSEIIAEHERCAEPAPFCWVIPGDDNADVNGFIDARIECMGEFTRPLYAEPLPKVPA